MQHMFDTGADMVVVGGEKYLRFVFQSPERQGMNDFCLVAEILVAQIRDVWMSAAEVNFFAERIFYHKIMIP